MKPAQSPGPGQDRQKQSGMLPAAAPQQPDYARHEAQYQQARQAGWEGWGGPARLARAELVPRFLAAAAPPRPGRLLELGCGEGHHARAFAALGYTVSGVDISATAIAWAQEKAAATGLPGRFFVADLSDSTLCLPGPFEVVIDGNCLHCIIGEDRKTVLGHVFAALVADGLFFVSSLCSPFGRSTWITRQGRPYRQIQPVELLAEELTQAGFGILKLQRYSRPVHDHVTILARRPSQA